MHNALQKAASASASAEGDGEKRTYAATLTACRPLWCQLLLALVAQPTSAAAPTTNAPGSEGEGDPALEWAQLLVCGLFEGDPACVGRLFALVGSRGGKGSPEAVWGSGRDRDRDRDRVSAADVPLPHAEAGAEAEAGAGAEGEAWQPTHEQVLLLQLLRDTLEGRDSAACSAGLLGTASFVAFLRTLSLSLCTLTADRLAGQPTGVTVLWLAAVPSALGVLGAALAVDVPDPRELVQLAVALTQAAPVVDFALHCLSDLPVMEGVPDSYVCVCLGVCVCLSPLSLCVHIPALPLTPAPAPRSQLPL